VRACSPEVDAHEAGEHQLAEYRAEPFGLGDLVLAASVGRAGGLGDGGRGFFVRLMPPSSIVKTCGACYSVAPYRLLHIIRQ
jgi:hypothetical protein